MTDRNELLKVGLYTAVGLAIATAPLAGYHASVGAILGVIQAVGLMIPILKGPSWLRKMVRRFPMAADVVLTIAVTWANAYAFGPGLTLAMAAATTGALLSVLLPRVPLCRSPDPGERS